MPKSGIATVLLCLILTACSSTGTSGSGQSMGAGPVQVTLDGPRRDLLQRLYDRVALSEGSDGVEAARSITNLPDEELRYIEMLWGPRVQTRLVARRIANAFHPDGIEAGWHSYDEVTAAGMAERWLLRALALRHPVSYSEELTLRYDLARAFAAQGRADEALDMLVNRPDPRPLPPELEAPFEVLIAQLTAQR